MRAPTTLCKNDKIPDMTSSDSTPGQLRAIAELRWRMFVNGLRSRRGKVELASRIIVTSAFAFGGLGSFRLRDRTLLVFRVAR